MSDQIISRAHIHAKGAAAFAAGRGINDHGMNPGASAIADWQAGWTQARHEAQRREVAA